MLKLSALKHSSVYPSKVEKQKMSLAIDVFCDKTATALETISTSDDSFKDTARFIRRVVELWKLLNCKSRFQSQRRNDPDRAAIDGSSCPGIQLLQKWANSEVLLPSNKGRVNTLTKDTSEALSWTCNALISLCRHLLETDKGYRHIYVCLGFYFYILCLSYSSTTSI